MLRPELRALAEASAYVLIVGRTAEVRRTAGGFTDVMLKNCTVRQVERGEPKFKHPGIRTDHLWFRMPTDMVEPIAAPPECPTDLRHLYRRPGIEMLKKVRILGRAGFYTQADGSLGIGVPEVLPVISEQRVLGMLNTAVNCFREHPWRPECLQTLVDMVGKVQRTLRDEWVLLDQPADEAISELERIATRARRDHAAEVKARRKRGIQPTLPGFNPALEGAARKGGQLSAVDKLLGREALKAKWEKGYGKLQ